MRVEPFLACGTFVLVVGVVLAIISVASDDWVDFPDGSHTGLWRLCPASGSCQFLDVDDSPDELNAVRAMMILTVIVAGIALVLAVMELIYSTVRKYNTCNRWVIRFVAFSSLFAALLCLIGIVVYHGEIYEEYDDRNTEPEYRYSFWVGMVAILVFFLAGILFLISAFRYKEFRRQRTELAIRQRALERATALRNPYLRQEPVYESNAFTLPPEINNTRGHRDILASDINYYRRYGDTKSYESGFKKSKDWKSRSSHNGSAYPNQQSVFTTSPENAQLYYTAPGVFPIYNHGVTDASGRASRQGNYLSRGRTGQSSYQGQSFEKMTTREYRSNLRGTNNIYTSVQRQNPIPDYVGAAINPSALPVSSRSFGGRNVNDSSKIENTIGQPTMWGISTKGEKVVDQIGNVVYDGSKRGDKDYLAVPTLAEALSTSGRGSRIENLDSSSRGVNAGIWGSSSRGVNAGILGSSSRGVDAAILGSSSRGQGAGNLGGSYGGWNNLGQQSDNLVRSIIANDGQNAFGRSIGSSGRDPYGYPLDYDRDL